MTVFSKIGWLVVLLVVLAGGFYVLQMRNSVTSTSGQPAASLAVSPTMVATALPTATPQPTGAGLGTTYITATDWPPKVQILDKAYSCIPAGSPIGQGGQTRKVTINGHDYCVTEANEGVAGSTYTTYTYTWAQGDKTGQLTFVLRFVQCANYDEPQKTACKNEQSAFDVGPLVDAIAQGLH